MSKKLIRRRALSLLLCLAILSSPVGAVFAARDDVDELNSEIYSITNIEKWHDAGYLGDGIHIVIMDEPVDVDFYRKNFGANVSNFGHGHKKDANKRHGNIVFDTMFQIAPNAKYTIVPSGLTGINHIGLINEKIDIINSSYDRLYGSYKLSSYIDNGTTVFKSGGNIKYGELVEDGYNEIRDIAINVAAVSMITFNQEKSIIEPYYGMVTPTIDTTGFTNTGVRVPGVEGRINTYYPSGTSISAPFVAAMTALYKQKFIEENSRVPSISETRGFIKNNSMKIQEFTDMNNFSYKKNNSKYEDVGKRHEDFSDEERYGYGVFVLPNPNKKIKKSRSVGDRLNKEWNYWDPELAKLKRFIINQDSIDSYIDEKENVINDIEEINNYKEVTIENIDNIINKHRSIFEFVDVDRNDIDNIISLKRKELSIDEVNEILLETKIYIDEYKEFLLEERSNEIDLIEDVLEEKIEISVDKAKDLNYIILNTIKSKLIEKEKENLKNIIEQAKDIDLVDKTDDSRKNINKYINISEKVLEKSNDVEGLKIAAIDLTEAIESMQVFDGYIELQRTLNEAKNINTEGKTKDSVNKLYDSIKNTEHYIGSRIPNIKVEALVDDLKNNINGLKNIESSVDKDSDNSDAGNNIEFITDKPIDKPIEDFNDVKNDKNINVIKNENDINKKEDNLTDHLNNDKVKPDNIKSKFKGVVPVNSKGQIQSIIVKESKPYIKGYTDNTFKPNKSITKEEALLILNRVFFDGYKTISSNIQNNGSKWSIEDINNLIYNKVIPNNYNVKEDMTREEFVEIVIKGIYGEKIKTSYKSSLIDVNKNQYILKALELNIIQGYGDNTFKGDNTITRAEFVTIINNLINRKEFTNKENKFNDLNKNHWYYEDILKAI